MKVSIVLMVDWVPAFEIEIEIHLKWLLIID